MRIITTLLLLMILAGQKTSYSQDTLKLSLKEVIKMAKQQSPDAKAAINRFKNSYWQYETYQAQKLPELTLHGTLPDLNRSIDEVTQPDGSDKFVNRQQANYSTRLSLAQELPFTGGSVFLNSNLRRIDLFGENRSTSYLSTPLSIGFRQPLFAFNSFKWNNKIEPLKYRESKRQYLQSMEQVSIKAVNLFFDVYLAKINISIASNNKANKDTLYKIAKGRYNMGKIAENELLQMELSRLNADFSVEQSRLDYENSLFRLKSFLSLNKNTNIKLVPPEKPETYKVSKEKALAQGRENRQETLQFERKLLQAEKEVARARKNSGLRNASLYAQFGLSNDANDLPGAYTRPEDQEQLQIGFSLPILDWGRSKANRKMAKANQDLVKTNVKQQKIDFRQQIVLAVQEFNMQAKQLKIAAKANRIGQKRYRITKNRFKIGKVDITDLNLAANERDKARRSFIQSLRNYWTSKYKLRKLTLYNFPEDQPLEFDKEEIL